jgi:small subunit ribosomal protein S8
MFMTDPISDMLARIRNAQMRSHERVEIPFSNVKIAISKILKNEGYIDSAEVETNGKFKVIVLKLKYNDDSPVIKEISRISKPGRRVYVSASKMPLVNSGLGISIVSTSKGLVSDAEARQHNVGGEVICSIF